MTDPRLLDTGIGSTPVTQTPRESLPDDLLREATRRLGLLCMVWAGLWTLNLVLQHLVAPLFALPMMEVVPWGPQGDAVAALSIGLSLGLAAYTRQLWCRPQLALDLSLVYEIILAFLIALVNQWYPRILVGRVSWICVLVLIFPMIVPNTPRKTLIASMIAASMDPFAIGIAALRGLEVPSLPLIFAAYLPNYVCALLAVIPSKIITRLGGQVRRARELGSYQLGDRIGGGGMGEVWRARHRLLARPAAIKLIKPERLDDGPGGRRSVSVARFRREAEIAASLQSPHTIHIYDFGEARDGTFYLVMELLDGLDLETLIRRYGPVPPARAVALLTQACQSLAEAHGRGLIHRDVKPANIFLCRMGLDYDFVKVLDFGLAKGDRDRSLMDTMQTGGHVTTGTPAYMAPEVAAGETVDRRADIYALGCVGYWLLTGQLVFEAETALQMAVKHLQTEPVPPSQRADQHIPAPLEQVILRCLAKQPEDRPASAIELADMLTRSVDVRSWDQRRARAWWEEHNPGAPATDDPLAALEPPERGRALACDPAKF